MDVRKLSGPESKGLVPINHKINIIVIIKFILN